MDNFWKRTVYKYLNLIYLSPKFINDILRSNIPEKINLQGMFNIPYLYTTFDQ